MHEYTVIGHPREKIIFYIAYFSIFIAPLISKALNFSLENYLNILTCLSIGSTTIFALGYLLFNKIIWKNKFFMHVYNFPNLNGKWDCIGLSFNKNTNTEIEWKGQMIITQKWDKILIAIQTENSTSQSISVIGGIKFYSGLGYRLSYNYENQPSVTEQELKKHEGFCTLTFNENLSKAEGSYFNNVKERNTFGQIKLIRGK